jgi:signal transduction histidine kinase
MLLTLAPVASIAVQNALAFQQRMTTLTELEKSAKQYQELAASLEATREEERINVARELHDQLGQSLTGIKYDLAWLSSQIGRTDETLEEKTKGILAQLNQTIQTVRQIAAQLRPGMLEDLGLVASIEWQVQDFEKRTGIQCSISVLDDDEILPSEKSLAIYRILQEGLTHVAQHSETKKVEVSLQRSGDLVTLELHDYGRGISAEEISDNHSLGIMGMRERAQQLGGTFDVHGDPHNGTTLTVSFPISVEG